MATLYITEYNNCVVMPNALGQVPVEPPIMEQTVAIGPSSLLSAAFQPKTRLIRLHCDVICSVLFGFVISPPVALLTSGRMVAGQTEFRGVLEHNGVLEREMQVAVIGNT